MKHVTLAALAILGLALADTPRFAPADKSSVEKTIRSEMSFAATEFSISVGGRDLPKELLGDMVLKFEQVEKCVITDRYVRVKDGRPLELDRTYDELTRTERNTSRKPGDEDESVEEKAKESDLESKTVRFSWNAKTEEYDTAFAGEDGAAALLEDLKEDIDFRGFLPADDVRVGDTWKLDGKHFSQLLGIGGDLHFHEAGEEEKEDDGEDFGSQLDENMSGEALLKFAEVREKDGLRLAVITFESEFKSHAEMKKQGFHVEAELDPEGELLWDLEANRIHALEVKSTLTMTMKGDQKVGPEDQQQDMHMEIALAGSIEIEVLIKAP